MSHSCNDHAFPCSCQQAIDSRDEKKSVHNTSRRDFLKYSGVALAGLGIAPAISYWLREDGKINEIIKNAAVVRGKAQRFTILHTTDIHGQLDVHDEFFWQEGKPVYKKRGGFDTLKTMINALRKQNANTLLVDGGDCFQGSAMAALTEGRSIVTLANELHYDLVLPGNWEVVYGKKMLMKGMSDHTAAKVCANMFHSDRADGESLFPPYQIFSFGETKIGFIGYNDPLTPIRQSPAYSTGILFTEPGKDMAQYVKILREEKGCALVFVLSHMGLAQQLHLANQKHAQGVDYILGADTHERIREPIQGKYAKVTEPGAFASFVGKLDIVIEKGKIKDEVYELLDVDPEKYAGDPEMKRLIVSVKEPFEKTLNEIIGQTTTPLVRYFVLETPMDNLITDAVMWRMKPDIALSNGFRFCPPLLPDPETGVAHITRDYLWSMLPVNSEIKTANVSGQQIMEWLENELENAFAKDASKRFGGWFVRFAGMQVTFTIANKKGKRVQHVFVQGEGIEPGKTYRIAACEREGDPDTILCRMKNVRNPVSSGILLHDAVEQYLAVASPVSPKIEGRATAMDAPQTLLTQIFGVNYQFM
jgi:S-sulfosulfanyl-L-cysteine sulfohydrolase